MQSMRIRESVFYGAIVAVVVTFVGLTHAAFADLPITGPGTASDPYMIGTCAELAAIKNDRSAYYALSQDVDCDVAPYNDSEAGGFTPIGQDGDTDFNGTLDGRGHAITGLLISSSSQNVGLFGYTEGAKIKNLAITGGTSVSGPYVVGGLVGVAGFGTTITNVYVTGIIQSPEGDSYVGGLVGNAINATIRNSYSTATISGGRSGGLVGWGAGAIESSFSTSSVTGSFYKGGVVGGSAGSMTLKNVFAVQAPVLDFDGGGTVQTHTGLADGESDFYQGDTMNVYGNSSYSTWDFDTTWKFNDASSLPVLRPIVTSTTSAALSNAESGKSVTLQTPVGTNITCSSTVKESANTAQDAGYSYPLGLVNFCFTTGVGSNQVTLTFVTNLTPGQVTVRKYDPSGHTYATVTGAIVTETTSGGQHALQVVYTVVDNGPLDSNPTAGVIDDPVGLAVTNAPGAPNTGVGRQTTSELVVLGGMIVAAAVFAAVAYRISKNDNR